MQPPDKLIDIYRVFFFFLATGDNEIAILMGGFF